MSLNSEKKKKKKKKNDRVSVIAHYFFLTYFINFEEKLDTREISKTLIDSHFRIYMSFSVNKVHADYLPSLLVRS